MDRENFDYSEYLKDLRKRYPYLPEKQIKAKAQKIWPKLNVGKMASKKLAEKNYSRLRYKSIQSISSPVPKPILSPITKSISPSVIFLNSSSSKENEIIDLCSSSSGSEKSSQPISIEKNSISIEKRISTKSPILEKRISTKSPMLERNSMKSPTLEENPMKTPINQIIDWPYPRLRSPNTPDSFSYYRPTTPDPWPNVGPDSPEVQCLSEDADECESVAEQQEGEKEAEDGGENFQFNESDSSDSGNALLKLFDSPDEGHRSLRI